jgi:hypothetical protein
MQHTVSRVIDLVTALNYPFEAPLSSGSDISGGSVADDSVTKLEKTAKWRLQGFRTFARPDVANVNEPLENDGVHSALEISPAFMSQMFLNTRKVMAFTAL